MDGDDRHDPGEGVGRGGDLLAAGLTAGRPEQALDPLDTDEAPDVDAGPEA